MIFSKGNALLVLAFAIAALFISACAGNEQSAEPKPSNTGTTQQAATTQPNPPPKPGAEQNPATQPKMSKEPEFELSFPVNASSAAVGSTITVPITISSKSTREIFSYSFAVMFDPKVLQPTDQPISMTGTLSDGFMAAADSKTTGRLGIASASANKTVKTNGTLLNTHFKVIGKGAEKMNLTIANPVFEDLDGNRINVTATMKQ